MTVLLVLSLGITFLLVDLVYRRISKKETVFASSASTVNIRRAITEVFIPQSLFFGKGHTWVNVRRSGNVQIGIDDFAQKFIGKIDRFSFKAIGNEVKKGETFLSVESNGKKLSFVSPVSGTIHSLNNNVINNPNVVSSNPYDESWLCVIKPKNLSAELKLMKIADEASEWLKSEMNRLKDFLLGSNLKDSLVGATLHDGGVPVAGSLKQLDVTSCEKFQKEFLAE